MTEKWQGTVTPFEIEEDEEPSQHQALPGNWLHSSSDDQGFYFTAQPTLGEQFLDLIGNSFRAIWSAAVSKSKGPLTKV